MSATDALGPTGEVAPLRDGLLIMDIADTVRRSPELRDSHDPTAQLADLYRMLGITPTPAELADGIAASRDGRFDHVAPRRGTGLRLARLYVGRRRWRAPVLAAILTLAIGLGGYFLVYGPYQSSQAQQTRLDLEQRLPAQMDALYQTIFEQTKVQQAVVAAAQLREQGQAAAARGDRDGAGAAVAGLIQLRNTLQRDYTLRVVDRPGVKWGFWTFPEDNSAATNYYIVVEARDSDNHVLSLPVLDERTGRTDTVSQWALRVPEEVYRAVEADKGDDGVIEHNLVGAKSFGFLDPEYTVGVMGGAVTRW